MEKNTVCVDLSRYEQLLETERLAKQLAKELEALAEPLAEYGSLCQYFESKPWERGFYEEWLAKQHEPAEPPKPSKDCLTAMAEQSWHDCPKAVE